MTYFGIERELSAFTRRNQFRLDYEESQWMFMLHCPGSDVLPLQSLQHTQEGSCREKEAYLKSTQCEDPSGECNVVDPRCHKEELEFLDPIKERCAPMDPDNIQRTGIYMQNKARK